MKGPGRRSETEIDKSKQNKQSLDEFTEETSSWKKEVYQNVFMEIMIKWFRTRKESSVNTFKGTSIYIFIYSQLRIKSI